MIERIELSNFQCHSHLCLDFDKITTLVGASDSGKTAVLRALDWVCFNRGRTALLLRRGEKDMSVKLLVDGHSITRTTKQNSYWIDKQQLSTIGKTQPQEVTNIMRMTDENVQRQHDYLFWFSCNGSGLVQQLNRVVDLTELEGWVREGVGRERHSKERLDNHQDEKSAITDRRDALAVNIQADAELKALENFADKYEVTYGQVYLPLTKMLEELDEVEREYSRLSGFVKDLTQLISITESLNAYIKRSDQLSCSIDRIQDANDEIELLTDMLAESKYTIDSWTALQSVAGLSSALSVMVKNVSELTKQEDEQKRYVTALSGIVATGDDVVTLRARYTTLVAQLKVIDTPVPDMSELKALYVECEGLRDRYTGLDQSLTKIASADKDLADGKAAYADIKVEFDEQSEGICPICGGKLNDGCINE